MEVEPYIVQAKELYSYISSFLESENSEFQDLKEIIDQQEIEKNVKRLNELLLLIFSIGDNHHRTMDLFDKLVIILKYITKNQQLPVKEILDIFVANKWLLLLLFEHKVIIPDTSIVEYLMKSYNIIDKKLKYYLFREIKNLLDEKEIKIIEKEITQKFDENIEAFEQKCKEGENDSPLCKMIRQDSIQDFVSYVNQTNLPLTKTIQPDFYESNTFLIENEPSLIEYAFFYGSIQVIKYLKNNHVEFTPDCWLYAIHSNNPEMIELLVESEIQPIDSTYEKCLKESIKCHHNDIACYIKENLLNESQEEVVKGQDYNLEETIAKFHNCYFYPDDSLSMISNSNNFKLYLFASSFTTITIPSSVKSIGDYAFCGLKLLKQISIPSLVNSIGNYAFYGCSSLVNISISSSVTSLGSNIFRGCTSLKKIVIPSKIAKIEDYSFYGCSSLIQISFPSLLISIGNYAFTGCLSLVQVSIPSSVISIGDSAFKCTSLTKIKIPPFVVSIGNNIFKGCKSLEQVIIPSSVTSIGDDAFYECSSLTQISIPSSVTKIGNKAFSNCSLLTKIIFEIPSSVTEIEDYAFSGCSSLTQISIPSSVTKIGYKAFYECSSLTQISIPSSVTSIRSKAFSNCSLLAKIIFEIPSSVTKIEYSTFSGCSSLTQISIPSSVTSIGSKAFSNCSLLTKIIFEIPSSVTEIGYSTFSECSSLTQISIPSSVTSIGEGTFSYCSSLTQISIPSSLKMQTRYLNQNVNILEI